MITGKRGFLGSKLNDVDGKCIHTRWLGVERKFHNDPMQFDNLQIVRDLFDEDYSEFIGFGSQAEFHGGQTMYARAKLAARILSRELCEKNEINWKWARIYSVYGPGDGQNKLLMNVIRRLLLGETVYLNGCDKLWDYLYIDDAADMLNSIIASDDKDMVYEVAYGESFNLRDILEYVAEKVGSGKLLFSNEYAGSNLVLKGESLFTPKVDIYTGLERTIEWVKAHSY